jgi:hypothetical protein
MADDRWPLADLKICYNPDVGHRPTANGHPFKVICIFNGSRLPFIPTTLFACAPKTGNVETKSFFVATIKNYC